MEDQPTGGVLKAVFNDGTFLSFMPGTSDKVMDEAVRDHIARKKRKSRPHPSPGLTEGTTQAFLGGASGGFADEIQGAVAAATAKLGGIDEPFQDLRRQATEELRADREAFSRDHAGLSLGAEGVGSLLVGGKALAEQGLIKGGALAGGIFGAGNADAPKLLSVDTGMRAVVGASMGAGLGGGISLTIKAVPVVGAAIRKLLPRSRVKILDDNNMITPEAINQLRKQGYGQEETMGIIRRALMDKDVLTPEQAERFNLFSRNQVTPNRANVTRDIDDFRELGDLRKETGKVDTLITHQDKEIITAVNRQLDEINTTSGDIVETSTQVYQVVNNVTERLDDAINFAYKTAREQVAGRRVVSLDKLIETLKLRQGDEALSKGVISSVRGDLINHRAIGKKRKLLTVDEAENIRKNLNSKWDSTSGAGRKLITELKNALDDDVASVIGEDVFKAARQAKKDFHQLIERGRRDRFDRSKDGLLEKIVYNDIPEEKIVTVLLSNATRKADFDNVKIFLTQESGEAGLQVWNNIRGQFIRDSLEKAITGPIFNARKFAAEFKRLKRSGRFTEMYSEAERRFINDIEEIGILRVPPDQVRQGSGPSGAAVESAWKAILARMPFVQPVAAGTQAATRAQRQNRMVDPLRETIRSVGE